MTTHPPPAAALRPSESPRVDSAERVPWVSNGLAAGVVGAASFAAFFLLIDVVMGRPFWTPHVLGAVLFRGDIPSAFATPELLMIAGYTAVHFTIYIGLALPAAFFVLARLPSTRGRGRPALLAAVLFVTFELVFWSLAQLFAPSLLGMLTIGRVAVANLLAACAMSAFLFSRVRRRRPRRRNETGSHRPPRAS